MSDDDGNNCGNNNNNIIIIITIIYSIKNSTTTIRGVSGRNDYGSTSMHHYNNKYNKFEKQSHNHH
jgi:hypothetical protein